MSLAGEFHDVDPERVEKDLAELTAACAADRGDTPIDQLTGLAGLLAPGGHLDSGPPRDAGALHLDTTLHRRRGHPAALAICLAEIARRRGLPIGIAGDGAHLFLAHESPYIPVVIDPSSTGLRHAHTIAPELGWCCSHQTSSHLLTRLVRQTERHGDLAAAIRAAELRTPAPVRHDSSHHTHRDLTRIRARLN